MKLPNPLAGPASSVSVAALSETAAAETQLQRAKVQSQEQALEERLALDPAVAADYSAAKKQGDAALLRSLVARYDPIGFRSLVSESKRSKQLLKLSLSLRALSLDLAAVTPTPSALPQALIAEHHRLTRMLSDVRAVKKAVAAAGPSSLAAKSFPASQAAALESELSARLAALEEARTAAEPSPPPSAAQSLGQLLGDPALERALEETALQLDPRARAPFQAQLGSFLRLATVALSAPDYARTGMSYDYPGSRAEYRAQAFDPWMSFAALDRQRGSREACRAALSAVLESPKPAEAMGEALIASFLREIGASRDSLRPPPRVELVQKALEAELLLPLRALQETADDMVQAALRPVAPEPFEPAAEHSSAQALLAQTRALIDTLTAEVLGGDYRRWRYRNALSAESLSGLDRPGRQTWISSELQLQRPVAGGALHSREEDDLGLFWVTKIGGPSHGFDVGGHCLLPLLANGRTKAIILDDDRFLRGPAARAYVRVLLNAEGEPRLYLEPLQRDFLHRSERKGPEEDEPLRAAILAHAAAKAQAMGVPLSFPEEYRAAAAALGRSPQVKEERYRVGAGTGIFEASDTLGLGHDFLNLKPALTPALTRWML